MQSEEGVSLEVALVNAAKSGYVDDLQQLVKSAVDINVTDPLGNTPLHYAAGAGHAGN